VFGSQWNSRNISTARADPLGPDNLRSATLVRKTQLPGGGSGRSPSQGRMSGTSQSGHKKKFPTSRIIPRKRASCKPIWRSFAAGASPSTALTGSPLPPFDPFAQRSRIRLGTLVHDRLGEQISNPDLATIRRHDPHPGVPNRQDDLRREAAGQPGKVGTE